MVTQMITMLSMTYKQTPLGTEIKRLRRDLDVTQEWIAERLGVERETISAIERGKTKRPGDDILDGLERHLGLTRQRAYELMGGIHDRDQPKDDELKQTIIRIGTLKDPAARLAAVQSLPDEVRDAILLIASDYLLGAGQQLLAAREQAEIQQP